MISRRGFIKNTAKAITVVAVCPSLLTDNSVKTPQIYFGSSPESFVYANAGDIYSRMDGTNTTLYVHRGSTLNNTEWVAV